MKASTIDLVAIGERMKTARESLGLSRPEFVEIYGGSVRTLENNERGRNEPGAATLSAFMALGVNANWLLTGEGPMLLAELARKEAQSPRINAEALSAILRGLLEAGAPPAKACTAAVEFYQISIDRGDITPDGIGDGQKAAA